MGTDRIYATILFVVIFVVVLSFNVDLKQEQEMKKERCKMKTWIKNNEKSLNTMERNRVEAQGN